MNNYIVFIGLFLVLVLFFLRYFNKYNQGFGAKAWDLRFGFWMMGLPKLVVPSKASKQEKRILFLLTLFYFLAAVMIVATIILRRYIYSE